MVMVPNTIVRFAWKGLLKAVMLSSVIRMGERLIHIMSITPMITAVIASVLPDLFTINPSRKRPNIPLKIEARAHQPRTLRLHQQYCYQDTKEPGNQ